MNFVSRNRTTCLLAIGLVAVGLLGCGKAKEELGVITGKVEVDGEAVLDATVFFHRWNRGIHIMARLDEQGFYKVYTAGGQGLPLGEYQVNVVPNGPLVETDMETGRIIVPAGSKKPKSIVPLKYQDEKTSGLVVTVTSGKNEFNILMSKDG